MEKAKVYFTDFRTSNGVGLPEKLKRLCRKAGLQTMDLENKFVAIKMHFGELGNIAIYTALNRNNTIICTAKTISDNNMTACCYFIKAIFLRTI